jgi:hypothetical protein
LHCSTRSDLFATELRTRYVSDTAVCVLKSGVLLNTIKGNLVAFEIGQCMSNDNLDDPSGRLNKSHGGVCTMAWVGRPQVLEKV